MKPARHLIEIGDSADVLPRLAGQLSGRVDMVYIDPPYDHGDGGRRGSQRRFAYDDQRAGDWPSFMRECIEQCRPLLAPHAPVAVSIGHRRVHQLAGILADVFPGHEVVTITIDLRRAPTDRMGVQRTAEYLLIAVPPGTRLGAAGMTRGEVRNGWNGFALSGYDAGDYPNQVYPIWVDKADGRIVGAGPSVKQVALGAPTPAQPAGACAIRPLTRDGKSAVWRVARETFDELLAGGFVRADRPYMPGNVQPWTIKYVAGGTRKRILAGEIRTHGLDDRGALIIDRVAPVGAGVPAIWSGEGYETRAGTARLDELVPGHGFAYPKPVRLVADAIRVCTGGKPDAVILDFFAGSGTTLDAVCHLNEQDSGTRRAILVQLDEGDIVSRVLLPRARAIAGGGGFDVRVDLARRPVDSISRSATV